MRKKGLRSIKPIDVVVFLFVTGFVLLILIPFINVVMISLTTEKEYLQTPILLFPKQPTLQNYKQLFESGTVLNGYKISFLILLIGVPLDLFLTSTLAYALSQKGFPGRKAVLVFILFTMLFNGGIVPLYLVVKQLGLTNSILSVVFTQAISTYNMILMLNYFSSLPVSLLESARLDGAGEWKILWRIVLPLSMPIIATMLLFYSVARWNEWYQAMLFIRSIDKSPLQTVLRRIIMDSMNTDLLQSGDLDAVRFSTAIKMSAVMVTMVPVMCIFPFLQKHFVKGVMIGAIK
ncbi:MAG: carbohydrate ABC transporter permease [Clostridiales bacterium]|nr:carbohydrate ABC transporter permease [Clostridiales bacterium]PWM41073.1 MAG: carbohydrate ABC transporter permease [Clostridiales bacterium]